MRPPPTHEEIDAAVDRLNGLLGQDHPYVAQRRRKDEEVAAVINELGKLLGQEDPYVVLKRESERRQAVTDYSLKPIRLLAPRRSLWARLRARMTL